MLGSRLRQVLGAGALVALLLWPASGVSLAGGPDPCPLTVTPASGPAGTEFVFTGSGYSPTEARLTRGSEAPRVVPLSIDLSDPFHFSIVAGDGDVGRWKVEAVDTNGTCVGHVSIRVVLPGTSTATDALAADKTPMLAAFAGLAGVFVLSAAFIVRRSRRPV